MHAAAVQVVVVVVAVEESSCVVVVVQPGNPNPVNFLPRTAMPWAIVDAVDVVVCCRCEHGTILIVVVVVVVAQ